MVRRLLSTSKHPLGFLPSQVVVQLGVGLTLKAPSLCRKQPLSGICSFFSKLYIMYLFQPLLLFTTELHKSCQRYTFCKLNIIYADLKVPLPKLTHFLLIQPPVNFQDKGRKQPDSLPKYYVHVCMASCMASRPAADRNLALSETAQAGPPYFYLRLTVWTMNSKTNKKHFREENRLKSQLRNVDCIIKKNNFQKTTSASCTHYIQVFSMPSKRKPLGARPERLKEHSLVENSIYQPLETQKDLALSNC